MSGYASKAEAMAVVRATIAGSNRPADLPDDLSVYILSRIYAAVITSRGAGYGWGIEYDAATFWDAVRANLRTPASEPGMSWSEVADRDAAGYCPASPDYSEPHIADGDVCSECGAQLDAPTPRSDYADKIAADVLREHAIQPHWVRNGEQVAALLAEAARAGYALGLGVSS